MTSSFQKLSGIISNAVIIVVSRFTELSVNRLWLVLVTQS